MKYNDSKNILSILIKEAVLPKEVKYTIAIPTYKRAHLLKEALESAIHQNTNIPYHILVVDNNPERNCETEQLMNLYSASNISYYKNTENIGMTGNWNKLFELSSTDFVMMLHDDDLLYDDYIENVDNILKKYSYDIDALYLDVKIFKTTQDIQSNKTKNIKILKLKPSDFQFGNICNLVGAVFNRNTIIRINGFDSYFYPSLDYEMHVRLSKYGKAFKIYGYSTLYRISDNESMRFQTILKMADKDKEIMSSIVSEFPFFYTYLFKYYLNAYKKNYIIWNKKNYNTKDRQMDRYLMRKVTLFESLIFKIGSLMRGRILPMFRKKHLKIDI